MSSLGSEYHDVPDTRHVWQRLLEKREEVGVYEHRRVLRVVHDEDQFLDAQPHVECVQHASRARHGDVSRARA